MFEPIYRTVCQVWQADDNKQFFSFHLNQFALESFADQYQTLKKIGSWFYTGISIEDFNLLINSKDGIIKSGEIPKKMPSPKKTSYPSSIK